MRFGGFLVCVSGAVLGLAGALSITGVNAPAANAATFTVTTGNTETNQQSLGGETGTIETGANLTVNGTALVTAGTAGNTITNDGTISANGGGAAHGIQVTPSGGTTVITNNGTINATGTGNGVRLFANNNTLNQNGTINAATGADDAIYVNGDNNTIILGSAASFTGRINFDDGTGNILRYTTSYTCPTGGGTCTSNSPTLPTIIGTLNNTYSIDEINGGVSGGIPSGGTLVQGDGQTVLVTTQTNAGTTQTVDDVVKDVDDLVQQNTGAGTATGTTNTPDVSAIQAQIDANNKRIRELESGLRLRQHDVDSWSIHYQARRSLPVSFWRKSKNELDAAVAALAADNKEIADLKAKNQELEQQKQAILSGGVSSGSGYPLQAWSEVYGSFRERPNHGDSVYGISRSGGMVGGVNFPETVNGYNIGVFASLFAGKTKVGKPTTRTINTRGGMIGGVAGKQVGAFYVSGQMTAGYTDNDSDRVDGARIAAANYDAYFISPSLTVSRSFEAHSVRWSPSLNIGYNASFTDSYTESGGTVNQTVDSKTSQSLRARAQVKAQFPEIAAHGGTLTPALRVGIEGQTDIGSRSTDMRVLGTNLTVTPDADRTLDGIIGASFDFDMPQKDIQIYVDGEASIGLNKGGPSDNAGGTAKAGLRWSF